MKPFLVLDTEDDSEGRVLLLNFFDGAIHKTFYSPDAAREWLRAEKPSRLVWAVNLEYDMINLFKDDLKIFPRRIWFGKTKLVSFMFGRHLFYDTLNHWKISVEEMGRTVGIKKLPLDQTDPEALLRRCRVDCDITMSFVREMSRRYGILGARVKSTLPSSSLDLFHRCYNKMEYKKQETDKLDFVREAYYGGRTECFYLGKISLKKDPDRRVFYVDINSMYPSVMLNLYPYPYIFEEKPDLDSFGVTDCEVEADQDVPVLPLRREGKLVFPNGRFRGTWTNSEIKYALSYGKISIRKIYRGFKFPIGIKPFESFVTDLYDRRTKSDDVLMKDTYKLFMNSLYGKFGQGRVRKKLVSKETYYKDPLRFKACGDPFIFADEFVVFDEKADNYPPHAVVVWAAHVTAYARQKLHSLIRSVKARGGIPLYCDTDSIMFVGTRDMVEESKLLGRFKVEYVFDEVVIKLPKCYRCMVEDDIVVERSKGVPRRAGREFFDKGEATFRKPNKFFESMRRGLEMNKWEPVTKKLRGVYDKGILDPSGFVRPLVLG